MRKQTPTQSCIGYNDTEGKCGKPVVPPSRGAYWCPDCDKVRMDCIDKQFNDIAAKWGVDPNEIEVEVDPDTLRKAGEVVAHYSANPYQLPPGPIFIPDDEVQGPDEISTIVDPEE